MKNAKFSRIHKGSIVRTGRKNNAMQVYVGTANSEIRISEYPSDW